MASHSALPASPPTTAPTTEPRDNDDSDDSDEPPEMGDGDQPALGHVAERGAVRCPHRLAGRCLVDSGEGGDGLAGLDVPLRQRPQQPAAHQGLQRGEVALIPATQLLRAAAGARAVHRDELVPVEEILKMIPAARMGTSSRERLDEPLSSSLSKILSSEAPNTSAIRNASGSEGSYLPVSRE